MSNRITKIYCNKTDIFADANQFIAHYRRLASPCSIMRQRADVIAKTNPGKKVTDGWLHGLGVPLEYIEALFEHIPQIIVFFVFGSVPLVILGCIIGCSWMHRRCMLNCCGGAESNQTYNNISNQLSNQITN